MSGSSRGVSFSLDGLPQQLRRLLEANKPIQSVVLLKSPIDDGFITFGKILTLGLANFDHLQVMFLIENIYVILSFGQDGLQCVANRRSSEVINRRKQNKYINYVQGPFNSSSVLKFLIRKQHKPYDLLDWNCQHFAEQLFDQITSSYYVEPPYSNYQNEELQRSKLSQLGYKLLEKTKIIQKNEKIIKENGRTLNLLFARIVIEDLKRSGK